MIKKLAQRLTKFKIFNKLITNIHYRTVFFAVSSLIFNLSFAFYNGALGLLTGSAWFIALFVYYLFLGGIRFAAVASAKGNFKREHFVIRLTGILLTATSFVLAGIIYLSLSQNRAAKYGEIIMITIATYTFIKIGVAVTKASKHKNDRTPVYFVIRIVRYAEVSVSVFTMQRSMLVSFGNMPEDTAKLFNILTGAAVCLFTLALGITAIRRSDNLLKENNYGKIKNS